MSLMSGVSLVTTPLALLAFVVAAAFYAYRESLLNKRKTLQNIPANQRAQMLQETLRLFDVDTRNLSPRQQYEIALVQIHARERRILALFATICFLFVVFTSASILFAMIYNASPVGELTNGTAKSQRPDKPAQKKPSVESSGSVTPPKEAPPEPQVQWQPLPYGSRLGNRTSADVRVFAKPDIRSEEVTNISPGGTVSPRGAEERIERAVIQGESWYRFSVASGRMGYVHADALALGP